MLSTEYTLPDGSRIRAEHSLVALSFGEGIVCLKQMLNVMNALATTTSSSSEAEVNIIISLLIIIYFIIVYLFHFIRCNAAGIITSFACRDGWRII